MCLAGEFHGKFCQGQIEDSSLLCCVNFGDPFILCFDDKAFSPVNSEVSLVQRALMRSVGIFVNLLISAFCISAGMDLA